MRKILNKWEYFNDQLTNENDQVIKEIKTKATVKYHHIPTRAAKITQTGNK